MQQASLALRHTEDKKKKPLTKEVENIAFKLADIYRKNQVVGQRLKEAEGVLREAADPNDVHTLTRIEEILRLHQTEDVATLLIEPQKSDDEHFIRTDDERVVTSVSECDQQTHPGNKYKHITRATTDSQEDWEARVHNGREWCRRRAVGGAGRASPGHVLTLGYSNDAKTYYGLPLGNLFLRQDS